jgi:hypothetical protein
VKKKLLFLPFLDLDRASLPTFDQKSEIESVFYSFREIFGVIQDLFAFDGGQGIRTCIQKEAKRSIDVTSLKFSEASQNCFFEKIFNFHVRDSECSITS